jgi:hypothetical protein
MLDSRALKGDTMKRLTVKRTSWMEYRDTLAAFEPFKTGGSLFGVAEYWYTAGRLPDPYYSDYVNRREHIDYVVVSYSTPIAWHDDERGWVVPDVRYSVTTSVQQGKIHTAISMIGQPHHSRSWIESE